MIIKDISYKKLQLAVLEGEVDLSHLNIFKETYNNILTFGIKIHSGIIGTSHFVQIQKNDGSVFTEIFACDVLEKNEAQSLCFLPIKKINAPINIESHLSYSFSYHQKSYIESVNDITTWAKDEQENQPLVFLEYHFNVANPDCPSSRTILAITTIPDGIEINTVHEYQEEDAIIFSKSSMIF